MSKQRFRPMIFNFRQIYGLHKPEEQSLVKPYMKIIDKQINTINLDNLKLHSL